MFLMLHQMEMGLLFAGAEVKKVLRNCEDWAHIVYNIHDGKEMHRRKNA